MTKEQRAEIVSAMIEKLKSLPEGTEMTTGYLMHQMFPEEKPDIYETFDIHDDIIKAAKKNGLFLDMSKHDGLVEGWPFNLDYVIHHVEVKKTGKRKKADNVKRSEGEE